MAKYEELIDDFELEKRIRTIPEDMDLSEYIKQRGGVDYPEEEKADGAAKSQARREKCHPHPHGYFRRIGERAR